MAILVTGRSGALAKDIRNYFGEKFQNENVFYLGHRQLDLTNENEVSNFFDSHEINYILHTAIKGGRRTREESYDDFYQNLLMFQNLLSNSQKVKLFINFDSMATFDRRYSMDNIEDHVAFQRLPKDFYGLSKNIIYRLGQAQDNFLNLRIFSCFSENEPNDRMIKGNILRYMNKKPIVVHQNKLMDFVYSYDVIRAAEYFMKELKKETKRSYNICYSKKHSILEIANMINDLDKQKSDIIIEDEKLGMPITGCAKSIEKLNIKFAGIEEGIRKTYQAMVTSK